MSYTTSYQWGPSQTPVVIRSLIIITCIVSILAALTNSLFVHLAGTIGPQDILSLSWYGFRHYFLWQPLTYLFTQSTPSSGIDLFYLISLAFNMYILWAFGSSIHERIGSRQFLALYLVSGILAGVAAWFFMPIFSQYLVISGPSSAILSVFIVWAMLYPDSNLMLFMILPIKTKWLLAGVLGAIALSCISQLDIVSLLFYFIAASCGYLYSVILLNLESPFEFMHPFERSMTNFYHRLRRKTGSKQTEEIAKPKIYDFTSGEPILDDDAFIDSMLTKISKFGERSLSETERRRMQQISQRKMKNKAASDKD